MEIFNVKTEFQSFDGEYEYTKTDAAFTSKYDAEDFLDKLIQKYMSLWEAAKQNPRIIFETDDYFSVKLKNDDAVIFEISPQIVYDDVDKALKDAWA